MLRNKRIVFLSWATLAVLFFMAPLAFCLGPHECVLLVNRRSNDSIELANYYAHLRKIPPINIIHLDLPAKALEANASFTAKEFRELIYEPTQKVLKERRIAGHILTWLYSAGFPSTISTQPRMSLTGITFVRGRVPESGAIQSGNWLSPMFIGPDSATGSYSAPTSMEEFTLKLTTNMPLPSMMISWTGSRGLTVDEAKDNLRRSAASDGAHPSASVYFESTDDVRAKTRTWQFAQAQKELTGLGVAAFISSNAPPNRLDIMGILSGSRYARKKLSTPLQPGAYADHLTSFASVFNDPAQDKLTEWLKLGASGSSGTVTEPGSTTEPVVLWAKFPHARLFAHYASGCTLIESLYLSIRSPLQLLLVGDALCNPWAKPPGITLVNMAEDEAIPVKGMCEYLASSWGGFGQQPPTVIFFVDGRPVTTTGKANILNLDTKRLYDGSHSIRVVAYSYGSIRHQGFDMGVMQTRNRERSTTISGYEPRQKVDLHHPLTFRVSAEGTPREAAIVAQERVLVRAPYTNDVALTIPPFAVGAGPVSFQAVAVYPNNEPVRSEPLLLEIISMNSAPEIAAINIITNKDDALVANLAASDADNDTTSVFWYVDALKHGPAPQFFPDTNVENNSPESGTLTVALEQGFSCATVKADTPTQIKEIRTRVRFTENKSVSSKHNAGLVFNYIDGENYMFWGIDGKSSAWVLYRIDNGNNKKILSRGFPIRTDHEYDIMILSLENGQMGFFVDNDLIAIAEASFSAGRIGFRNGVEKTEYKHLMISPASAFRSYYSEQVDDLIVEAPHKDALSSIYGAARDVQYTTLKAVQ